MYWRAQGVRNGTSDDGIYTYVGWVWSQGGLPYRDAWDNKGPVVYAVSALRSALIGSQPEAIGIQEIVLGLTTAGLLAVLAFLLWESMAAATALAMGTLMWAQLVPGGNTDNGATSVLALFSTGAVTLAVAAALSDDRRRRWLLLMGFGVLEGLLFMTKANAIVTLPIAFLALAAVGSGLRDLVRAAVPVAAGFALPTLGFAILFLNNGAFDDAFSAAFLFNLTRGSAAFSVGSPMEIGIRAARFLKNVNLLVPLFAVALASVVQLWNWRTRGGLDGKSRLAVVVVTMWIALSAVEFVSNGGLFSSHIFAALPSIVLGSVLLTVLCARWDGLAPGPGPTRAVVVLLLAAPMALQVAAVPRGSMVKAPWRRMADVVSRETGPNDELLTFTGWAGPAILATAHRRSASRFFFPFPLHLRGPFKEQAWSEIADALKRPVPVRGVLTEVVGVPVPAGGATVEWALTNVDVALIPAAMTDDSVPAARRRVRETILRDYRIERCEGTVCLLTAVDRKGFTAEPASAPAHR
jgi:hypothetical protein